MACNNVITPTMIRKGQVQIGDKIEFEDMAVSAQNITEAPSAEVNPQVNLEVSPAVSAGGGYHSEYAKHHDKQHDK